MGGRLWIRGTAEVPVPILVAHLMLLGLKSTCFLPPLHFECGLWKKLGSSYGLDRWCRRAVVCSGGVDEALCRMLYWNLVLPRPVEPQGHVFWVGRVRWWRVESRRNTSLWIHVGMVTGSRAYPGGLGCGGRWCAPLACRGRMSGWLGGSFLVDKFDLSWTRVIHWL